ncbi:DUF917 domain-containing protein, partial [Clavibacter nebraskensis]
VVLALDAPAWWTATPERRAAVSPAAFGFGRVDVDTDADASASGARA